MIKDEFTDRPIDRRRKYQLRHKRDGLCELCPMRAAPGRNRCERHCWSEYTRLRRLLRGDKHSGV